MKKILTTAIILMTTLSVQSQAEEIKLWGTPVSPYVRKVMNVLEYKQVNYKQEEILPTALLKATGQEVPVDFQKASPLGKIPALTVGNHTITDSAVIVAYLERQYPDHPIYPSDSLEFTNAMWLEKYSDTVITDVIHPIFFERVVKPAVLGAKTDEALVAELVETKLPQILSYLNDWLAERKTHALVSDQLSIADFAIINHIIDLDASQIQWRDGNYVALENYVTRMMDERQIKKAIPKMLQTQN